MAPDSLPEVSVVIPTHDRWPLLADAIQSVLQQTFTDLELIVVDDGSADQTATGIRSFADPRLRYAPIPRSGNVARVRNQGIELSRGHWIAFLDSDDLWHPRKLELQLAALTKSRSLWSFGGHDVFAGDVRQTLRSFPQPARNWATPELVFELVNTHVAAIIPTLVVARDALQAIGGLSEAPSLNEDFDLVLRLAERFPAVSLSEILCSVREHPGRVTRRRADGFLPAANAFRALLLRDPLPAVQRAARRVLANHLTASAKIDLVSGSRAEARNKLRECAWPGILRARWWWLAVRAWVLG